MSNPAVHIHKISYEALLRLTWVSANQANKVSQVREVVAKVTEMAEAV